MTPSPDLGRPGLWDLDLVPLPPEQAEWLERLAGTVQGSPSWRRRKQAEVRDLFALAAIAPRLAVLAIDPRTTLLARLDLRAPVPCRIDGVGDVVIAQRARLVLRYPEEVMRMPLPGYAFVEIERPLGVFHPNVASPRMAHASFARSGPQLLCLGARIAAGTPVRELILASYQALCMAAYHLDPGAGAGVMSREAAAWWAANLARLPLTREPFLYAGGAEGAGA